MFPKGLRFAGNVEENEINMYFHGILNKIQKDLVFRGIFSNGVWVGAHLLVKVEFLEHFCSRFSRLIASRPLTT